MLKKGDTAPDLSLADSGGEIVRLSELWRRGPLVLIFLRHFG
jgi:peroxiredoxin